MMINDVQRWPQLASRLRRALGFVPPTIEEAEAEMAQADAVPMSDDEIGRIVDYATEEPLTTAES